MSSDKLSDKVIKGSFWIAFSSIVGRSLNIISSVLLTRWLLPSDFGIMALIMSIVSFTQMSTTTGFGSALIQKQNSSKNDFDVAWTFELIKFIILFISLYLLSPFLMKFFNSTSNKNLLQVMSVTFLFFGLRNIGIVYFRKELAFQKLFIFENIPLLLKVIVTLTFAYHSANVWALIYGQLAYTFSIFLFSYILHDFRPRLSFNLSVAKSLFGFGKWILSSSIVAMIKNQGIIMLISKIFGNVVLGYYNRSMVFSSFLFTEFREIFWKTGYASLSKLQNDKNKFNKAFLDFFAIMTLFGFAMSMGLYLAIPDFTNLFLGEKWAKIIPMIRIFCIIGCVSFINTTSLIAFQALGRPDINFIYSFLGMITLIIIIYPMIIYYDLMGILYSMLAVIILLAPFMVLKILSLLKIQFKELLSILLYSFSCTVSMCATLIYTKNYVLFVNSYFDFFLIIFLGIASFLLTAIFLEKLFNYSILTNLLNKMKIAYKNLMVN